MMEMGLSNLVRLSYLLIHEQLGICLRAWGWDHPKALQVRWRSNIRSRWRLLDFGISNSMHNSKEAHNEARAKKSVGMHDPSWQARPRMHDHAVHAWSTMPRHKHSLGGDMRTRHSPHMRHGPLSGSGRFHRLRGFFCADCTIRWPRCLQTW